jgi:hypothetical protein
MSNLIGISDYGIITFGNTSAALKAEKILKKEEREFMLIPTPREISASCGLALKFRPMYLQEYYQILNAENVHFEKVYLIQEQNRKKIINTVTL